MAPNALERVKLMVGIEPEPTSVIDDMDQCCSLSRKQRLYGWLGCFGIGSLLSIVSWFLIGSPIAFGVVYTFGNLISLFSSMFLCGPKRQFQNMTDKTRIGTTAVFLLFMGLTLFCAFKKPPSKIGVIICGFIQYLALLWYSLSYIPFARQIITRLMGGAVGV